MEGMEGGWFGRLWVSLRDGIEIDVDFFFPSTSSHVSGSSTLFPHSSAVLPPIYLLVLKSIGPLLSFPGSPSPLLSPPPLVIFVVSLLTLLDSDVSFSFVS